MRVAAIITCIVLFALPASVKAQGSPKIHELKASPATVHRGFFDASLKPVLTIDSGDIVRLETASSAAMDLVVTQVVDGTKGIHAMIPKAIFRR